MENSKVLNLKEIKWGDEGGGDTNLNDFFLEYIIKDYITEQKLFIFWIKNNY